MSKTEKVKVKVKVNNEALAKALGTKAGATVNVECKNGTPVDKYWRNRFKEAEIDNSITVPNNKPKKESSKPAASSSNEEA